MAFLSSGLPIYRRLRTQPESAMNVRRNGSLAELKCQDCRYVFMERVPQVSPYGVEERFRAELLDSRPHRCELPGKWLLASRGRNA